ncbi:hepatitis A virus cellular receptor 1 homolog isoform X2 [Megalops cyprinoides]|uniref:hepatitis A virus cellular receptor 1 homolog isoform X2 n=1 Tax=Megalops cyprinoides TaxID=118141 RepID=UPI001864CC82|nr:hepatitis A virus cellular receptor 1 homolog isoform X2 [Megalops cyprinoides]
MHTHNSYISLSWLLLYLLPVSESSPVTVHGYIGQSVTLPCRYNARYYGPLHMCWGRGYIPSSGCNNEFLSTDGIRVTYRKSSKYQLLGNLRTGDVSLTILNAQKGDYGIYGCRVHIPGWFNDQKIIVNLFLEEAPVTTTETPDFPEQETTTSLAFELPETTYATNAFADETTVTTHITTQELPETTYAFADETTVTADITTQEPLITEQPVPFPQPTDPEDMWKLFTDSHTEVPIGTAESLKSTPMPMDPETTWISRTDTSTQETLGSSSWSTDMEATTENQDSLDCWPACPTSIPQSPNSTSETEIDDFDDFMRMTDKDGLLQSGIALASVLLVVVLLLVSVHFMRKQCRRSQFKL